MTSGGSQIVGPWRSARYLAVRIPIGVDDVGEGDIAADIPGLVCPTIEGHGSWAVTIDLVAGRMLDWGQPERGFSVNLKVKDTGRYMLLDAGRNPIIQLVDSYVPHGILDGDFGDYLELDILEDGRIDRWPGILDTNDFENGTTDFSEPRSSEPQGHEPWVNPYEAELKSGDFTPQRRRELLTLARRYRMANPEYFEHRSR